MLPIPWGKAEKTLWKTYQSFTDEASTDRIPPWRRGIENFSFFCSLHDLLAIVDETGDDQPGDAVVKQAALWYFESMNNPAASQTIDANLEVLRRDITPTARQLAVEVQQIIIKLRTRFSQFTPILSQCKKKSLTEDHYEALGLSTAQQKTMLKRLACDGKSPVLMYGLIRKTLAMMPMKHILANNVADLVTTKLRTTTRQLLTENLSKLEKTWVETVVRAVLKDTNKFKADVQNERPRVVATLLLHEAILETPLDELRDLDTEEQQRKLLRTYIANIQGGSALHAWQDWVASQELHLRGGPSREEPEQKAVLTSFERLSQQDRRRTMLQAAAERAALEIFTAAAAPETLAVSNLDLVEPHVLPFHKTLRTYLRELLNAKNPENHLKDADLFKPELSLTLLTKWGVPNFEASSNDKLWMALQPTVEAALELGRRMQTTDSERTRNDLHPTTETQPDPEKHMVFLTKLLPKALLFDAAWPAVPCILTREETEKLLGISTTHGMTLASKEEPKRLIPSNTGRTAKEAIQATPNTTTEREKNRLPGKTPDTLIQAKKPNQKEEEAKEKEKETPKTRKEDAPIYEDLVYTTFFRTKSREHYRAVLQKFNEIDGNVIEMQGPTQIENRNGCYLHALLAAVFCDSKMKWVNQRNQFCREISKLYSTVKPTNIKNVLKTLNIELRKIGEENLARAISENQQQDLSEIGSKLFNFLGVNLGWGYEVEVKYRRPANSQNESYDYEQKFESPCVMMLNDHDNVVSVCSYQFLKGTESKEIRDVKDYFSMLHKFYVAQIYESAVAFGSFFHRSSDETIKLTVYHRVLLPGIKSPAGNLSAEGRPEVELVLKALCLKIEPAGGHYMSLIRMKNIWYCYDDLMQGYFIPILIHNEQNDIVNQLDAFMLKQYKLQDAIKNNVSFILYDNEDEGSVSHDSKQTNTSSCDASESGISQVLEDSMMNVKNKIQNYELDQQKSPSNEREKIIQQTKAISDRFGKFITFRKTNETTTPMASSSASGGPSASGSSASTIIIS